VATLGEVRLGANQYFVLRENLDIYLQLLYQLCPASMPRARRRPRDCDAAPGKNCSQKDTVVVLRIDQAMENPRGGATLACLAAWIGVFS
jgi:hypothetical protein